MSYDRDVVQAGIAERAKKRTAESMPALRMVQTVGVVMEQLQTRDANWNRYLQLMQGQVDRIKAAARTAEAKLADPAVWDHALLAKFKSELIEANAMIRMAELAMQLPKAIVEQARDADQIIAEFEKGKDESATSQP